jgi:hypothetical protein
MIADMQEPFQLRRHVLHQVCCISQVAAQCTQVLKCKLKRVDDTTLEASLGYVHS